MRVALAGGKGPASLNALIVFSRPDLATGRAAVGFVPEELAWAGSVGGDFEHGEASKAFVMRRANADLKVEGDASHCHTSREGQACRNACNDAHPYHDSNDSRDPRSSPHR